MPQGYLILELDGRRVAIGKGLTVGRTAECDLVIEDKLASRRHLEIERHGDTFIWGDLGSSNGTLQNGVKSDGGLLKNGDCLQVGDAKLRFELHADPAPPPHKEPTTLFPGTFLNASGEAVQELSGTKEQALLEAVYRVANEIATNYDPCVLMDRILAAALPAINAQRGAIFVAGPDESLLPCATCGKVHRIREGRLEPAAPGELRISRTVAHRVLLNGESILYQDTDRRGDNDLAEAASIVSLRLRSIVCVPLRGKHGILGILYIDSNREGHIYSQQDLLLAAAVGNSAGIALENAQMHQQLLEKQRMEQEIATAWTIQEGFLVKEWPAQDPRFEVYGETRPAKTVGGDFYDFVQPQPDIVGMLIGDVSGKGVPAALTMAQVLAQFRVFARDTACPGEVLRQLNADLVGRSRRGLFCTLCYLSLDLRTGVVRYANAGHSPVLRADAAGVTFFGDASGPPAGILEDAEWTVGEVTLSAGDSLLLYTDGILEARSVVTVTDVGTGALNEFGDAGVARVAQAYAAGGPHALLDALNEAVLRFCVPSAPHDDCTMIALRYAGNPH